MVRLREIPRTAAFAWSPEINSQWLVTGTKAGAVDVDFSNETVLELWNLALDKKGQGQELQPSITIPTESGFHDLAWGPPSSEYPKGVIAGALDSGSLALWDAAKLISNSSNASIYNQKIHSGAIRCLQFNPRISNFIATGGAKGEVFISNLNDLEAPIRLGSTAARADDIECLDWNTKVTGGNILVTGSSGGFVSVWDLKSKKESLTINHYGRKPVSAISWDPENSTRLITAVPSEQEPVILVWNLRNSNAPERILKGHDSGVLSLSWCPQDPDLLLSCGKDNRTILWNPNNGTAYGDYPVVTNWTFQTRWHPKNPDIFATASFDGKLLIQTLQSTNPQAIAQQEQSQTADGDDFFARAQTQPQTSSFTLSKAPKWLERPASVSFGFGGRIISVKPSAAGQRTSTISINKFEVDANVGMATSEFETAISSGNLAELTKTRQAEAKTEEEKADWQVMETLLSPNPRKDLIQYLGFGEVKNNTATIGKFDDLADKEDDAPADDEKSKAETNGPVKRHRRYESVFATNPDGDFLAQLAATRGTRTNNPFKLFSGSESEADKKITNYVMLGKFEDAFDVALGEGRMSDAFMLAICGGEKCIKKAQEAYLAKQEGGPNYLRLLASVVGKNLWDTVHNADVANWKEVMATLCTFADSKEFPDLCEALGDRLEEHMTDSTAARKDAAFCYLAGSKLEKVVAIWVQELREHEEAGASTEAEGTAFSVHARGLQDFIEKVTIFRRVVNFQDTELSNSADWKLDTLYSKYLEYADIVAAHGQLDAAQKYLDLLPSQYPDADVARSRILQAAKKRTTAATSAAARVPTTAAPAGLGMSKPLPPTNAAPMTGYQPPLNTFAPSGQVPAASAFAPQPTPFAANPYAPPQSQSAAQPSNPYGPPAGYQPPPQMTAAGPPMGAGYGGFAPPPRMNSSSPAVPPPSQNRNVPNWNDIPDGFAKAPTPRRNTPSVPAQSNPYAPTASAPGQGIAPPPQSPHGALATRSPAPPPPKAGGLPPRAMTPSASLERPPSVSNAYAPTPNAFAPQPEPLVPPVGQNVMSPPVSLQRTASPYNAPPRAPPPPNRYAPAPGSHSVAATPNPPGGRPAVAPPPQGSQFSAGPPPMNNPYAPSRPPPTASPSPYAPVQANAPISTGPPPMAAQPSLLPQQAEQPSVTTTAPPPPPTATVRHPKGDRSHIPSASQPVFEKLSNLMTVVRGRAPANFKPQVDDTDKRLNILYDHLNNQDLLKPDTIAQLVQLAEALERREFERASEIQMDVHTNKVEQCGNWMVGVKRLISMVRAIGGN